jgi:peptidoglycan hydrolase CwlO-like protein
MKNMKKFVSLIFATVMFATLLFSCDGIDTVDQSKEKQQNNLIALGFMQLNAQDQKLADAIEALIINLQTQIDSLSIDIDNIEGDITIINGKIVTIEGNITSIQTDLDIAELTIINIKVRLIIFL